MIKRPHHPRIHLVVAIHKAIRLARMLTYQVVTTLVQEIKDLLLDRCIRCNRNRALALVVRAVLVLRKDHLQPTSLAPVDQDRKIFHRAQLPGETL